MSQRWERRHAFVSVDTSMLNSMLQPAFPGKQVTSAQLLTEGYCNTNYKITVSGFAEAFVLRLYVRDHAACQKEVDIFNLVKESVPVPELLYADCDGLQYDRAYSVSTWVDGVLLSDILAEGNETDIAEAAYAVGTTLAPIGQYTFPQAGFFGPGLTIAQPLGDITSTVLGAIEECLFQGVAGEQLGKTLTEPLWNFVNDNVAYLDAIEHTASLVHADFKGINILMHRDKQQRWAVSAVLDWEFAFSNSPLFDIGNMLRYDRQYPQVFEREFIRGFIDQGGHLPTEWKHIARLLDLISLCQFLAMPAQRDTMVADVTALIIATLDAPLPGHSV